MTDPLPDDATVTDPEEDAIYEDPEIEPAKTDVPGQNEED